MEDNENVDISLQEQLKLRLKNGRVATIILYEENSFKELEKKIAKKGEKENGIQTVKLKDGSYAHIIYPESPLYKEITDMVKAKKNGKTNPMSKELEKLLFTPPKKIQNQKVDMNQFMGIETIQELAKLKKELNDLKKTVSNLKENSSELDPLPTPKNKSNNKPRMSTPKSNISF